MAHLNIIRTYAVHYEVIISGRKAKKKKDYLSICRKSRFPVGKIYQEIIIVIGSFDMLDCFENWFTRNQFL